MQVDHQMQHGRSAKDIKVRVLDIILTSSSHSSTISPATKIIDTNKIIQGRHARQRLKKGIRKAILANKFINSTNIDDDGEQDEYDDDDDDDDDDVRHLIDIDDDIYAVDDHDSSTYNDIEIEKKNTNFNDNTNTIKDERPSSTSTYISNIQNSAHPALENDDTITVTPIPISSSMETTKDKSNDHDANTRKLSQVHLLLLFLVYYSNYTYS